MNRTCARRVCGFLCVRLSRIFVSHFAAAARERDTTEYHDPPGDKRLSFFEHWTRALSAAAVYGDAARVLAHRKRVKEAAASGRAAQISRGAARA